VLVNSPTAWRMRFAVLEVEQSAIAAYFIANSQSGPSNGLYRSFSGWAEVRGRAVSEREVGIPLD
jgi:hypothetical protein